MVHDCLLFYHLVSRSIASRKYHPSGSLDKRLGLGPYIDTSKRPSLVLILHSYLRQSHSNSLSVQRLKPHTLTQDTADMTKPIALIIGAGKNIGAGTAKALQSKGYRVALAARSLKQEDSTNDRLLLSLDLSKPNSVGPAFASLREQWGEPSLVFYNGV